MKLETIIEETKDLLPSPQVIPKLLTALNDPNVSSERLVKLIKVDPALTAQVLSTSNGSFYGFSEPCLDLNDAINRIGFKELFRLVTTCLCQSVAAKPVANYYLDEGQLWENALTSAYVMELLAERFNLPVGQCYTVGLLHSLGKLVLNQLDDGLYASVFAEVDDNGLSLIEAEQKVLGFDHAQTCDALLTKWKYPDDIRVPIAHQYEPMKAESFIEVTSCLHISKYLITFVGCNHGRDALALEFSLETLDVLKINSDDLNLIALDITEKLSEIQKLIQTLAV